MAVSLDRKAFQKAIYHERCLAVSRAITGAGTIPGHGKQHGDPKLAEKAIVNATRAKEPPVHLVLGSEQNWCEIVRLAGK